MIMRISFLGSLKIARRLMLSVFLASLGALAFASSPALAAGEPMILEESSNNVRSFSVGLHVELGDPGPEDPTECLFQYGSTSVSEHEVSCGIFIFAPYAGAVGTTVVVNGLSPSTTYHYRAILKNAAGTTEGTPQEFTTPPASETPIDLKAEPTLTGVKLEGVLNPKATGIPGSYEFLYKQSGSECTGGKAVSGPATGAKEETVTSEVTGLLPKTVYTFCLRATNDQGGESATPSLPVTVTTLVVPPAISEESFSGVTLYHAELSARLNSGNGVATSYYFEYGTTSAYGSKTAPAGGESEFTGSAVAEELEPNTEYHFRVVATNTAGTSYGPDTTFTTQAVLTGLPDGRGYELVSHLANADSEVYPPEAPAEVVFTERVEPSPTRASADGDAVEFVADASNTGGTGHPNTYVAVHDSGGGWSSPVDLSTPEFDGAPFEALFTSELSNGGTSTVPADNYKLFQAKEALLEGEGPQQKELAEDIKRELQQEKPRLEEEAIKLLKEASEGIEGAANESEEKLSEAGGLPRDYLYESAEGQTELVAVLPDGAVVPEATFGSIENKEEVQEGGPKDFNHVVSADGSRIFWTDLEEGPNKEHLFVRENDTTTVPVSLGAAQFREASPDGRYVFYTEQQRLLRFDTENGSREELAGAGASVLGLVGINETGEDGAYVYFVAQGVLATGAKAGSDNLYLRHGGVTTFIAALLPEDIDRVGTGVALRSLEARTGEVSANGQAVVFESLASLTGYENDGNFEAFVYDADSARLSCVSCNPTGEPAVAPAFGADPHSALRGSSSESWPHRWISEDGTRVFFESTEGLVAQDTNGKRDVYEWEQEGTGSCENVKGCVYLLSGGTSTADSYFLDASANGDDVFIITGADLVPQDQGDTYEVYDVRVGAEEPVGEPVCTGTGCQGLPSAPPPFATPSSVTFNGVGNFPAGTGTNPPAAVKSPVKKAAKCPKGKTRNKRNQCIKVKAKKKATKAKKSVSNDRRVSR
jgi:hypothetical protein